jgi:hypothetical protein
MDKTMKSFTEYLSESAKKYDFKVKIAGAADTSVDAKLESLLSKWSVSSFKKSGTTPVQQSPLDFPKLKNEMVNMYEVTLDYPTTQFELKEYLTANLGLPKENLAVLRPGEPYDEYQQIVEKREEALLNDSEYKEAPNADWNEFYGDKYNVEFVKELNNVLKLQRKDRGEVIPESTKDEVIQNPGKTTNEIPQYNKAPLLQAYDPRK